MSLESDNVHHFENDLNKMDKLRAVAYKVSVFGAVSVGAMQGAQANELIAYIGGMSVVNLISWMAIERGYINLEEFDQTENYFGAVAKR